MTKSELRRGLKQSRLEMTDAEHTLKSRDLVEKLKTVCDWPKVKSLHYFEPITELLEPDISPLVVFLEDSYPTISLFAPKLIGGEWRMITIKDEPVPEQFDVILVPMLGFDPKTKHRIGYGGGYYDKFLATQPQAQKIGICFEAGKSNDLPVEAHDIPLNMIITETNTY